MKIECEIDWIEERDQTIDEAVREAIIDKLAFRVKDELYKNIEKQASEKYAGMIDELLLKLTDRFMNREIKVTDKWGTIQEEYANVEELLKNKFDAFLTQHVDQNGNTSNSCNYRGKAYTRFEYLIDGRIKEHKEKMIKELTRTMDEKIAEKKKEFMIEAGAKIAEKLGVV